MDIGRVGLWTFALDQLPHAQAVEVAQEIEAMGWPTVWMPEAVGKDPLVQSGLMLAATERLIMATGIANIYARDAMAMANGQRTLTEAFPDRFMLGIGVSHAPMVEGLRGHDWDKPLTFMRRYLDAMDASLYMAAPPTTDLHRCVGALGPKALALAAERTRGAHPYNVPPEHTAQARDIMGPDALLAPELAVVLSNDRDEALTLAREHASIYLGLPNYTNNLKRFGFEDSDFADGGSDRLLSVLVPHGDVDAIASAVAEHHDAGADHVCVQVLIGRDAGAPLEQWRELAPALTAQTG